MQLNVTLCTSALAKYLHTTVTTYTLRLSINYDELIIDTTFCCSTMLTDQIYTD